MDSQTYSRLLSYVVCETTMPIKKHVYNFAISGQTSLNPQIICAATQSAISQKQGNCQLISKILPKRVKMSGLPKEENDVSSVSHQTEELCEGTEIEKSALGDILNCESFDQSKVGLKRNFPIENVAKKQSVPKRRCYSKEENEVQVIDEVSSKLEGNSKCILRKTEIQNDMNQSHHTVSSDSFLFSDPLLLCSDEDFKVMFRVSRSTYKILLEMLSEEELEPIEDVPLYKKVLIVLWLLGSSGSYNDAAQVFELSEEVISSCFFDICATLYNKSDNFIRWPSTDEANEIASRIEQNFGFPGVVGVLGCQYFTISIPKETLSRREHFNGKLRMYCVSLQFVCDDLHIIRDIFPGLPGGIRPAQLLRDSPLGELLTTNATELVDANKHILARSEYPQLTSMLTPYTKNTESLTKDEQEFNTLHENVCLLVDQTFKMLKGRFRILKRLDPEVATMVLVTTCVLHNICIQNNDSFSI